MPRLTVFGRRGHWGWAAHLWFGNYVVGADWSSGGWPHGKSLWLSFGRFPRERSLAITQRRPVGLGLPRIRLYYPESDA